MKTGFTGTFVISWSQTEVDGLRAAPLGDLRVGASWSWGGDVVRLDGPADILPLGVAEGEADIRKRAAVSVRRMLRAVEVNSTRFDLIEVDPTLADHAFQVTDGRDIWTVTLIEGASPAARLCLFVGDLPPRATEMWIVQQRIETPPCTPSEDKASGVICFTPGTMIRTETGLMRVEDLREGTKVQTQDNGCQEVLWMGARRISGARLYAMPHLCPVRLRAGSLDHQVPDAGLLVSPDHRVLIKGARARALFNTDEVLVAARDLVDDQSIYTDRSTREVQYIHMLLPAHEVMFANGVATESFHPADADLDHLDGPQAARLRAQMPNATATTYGTHARRIISASEAALLRHDAPLAASPAPLSETKAARAAGRC